ncbi:YVTN repeat-like/Quino protein amine dehydrogenase [Hyaloscypha variabilis F]|uniref:YVTN repeat-like/Quino protein amine dehydrogenase n=1 Tax=Hyaloscypha variabilis (strain UAMH 11265 / GT02V1 / F) TaxID=1149755 RepID=A0A2J6R165_HYAVF|nr:YVTN repeat-like/Quino protein amine dehydrogenase [Hyaloscypha variabilis F]
MFKKHFTLRKKSGGDIDLHGESLGDSESLDSRSELLSSNSSTEPSTSPPSTSPPFRPRLPSVNTIDQQLTIPPDLGRGRDASNEDPLGLKVIHRPLGERRVDIVFIHGLGGSSRMTWSKDHNLDFFWPLKFLPHETDINEARILTFGYNANFRPGSGKNKMSVLDFAKDLLYDLKYGQDESAEELEDLMMGERPIIFIVHSMGGLIVKEAYMQGQNDPTYAAIIKSVSSIIFLATPHRGTNLAETLNRILQVSFITNPMQFIAELAAGSQTLQKLNEQFRHVAPKLQIVSFYETRPTTMFKKAQIMVVEKDSSVLGYPGEISKPLDADHHGVCKYSSPDDPRYITVRNVLKSLVGKMKPKDERRASTMLPTLDFEIYLSVPESPEKDYNFFRDRWASGTCNWLVKDSAFAGWLEDGHSKPRVLWIHGNAASGKSIISSFVIDHLAQLGLPCHYFFVRFTDQKKRALSMILRSLACQLANSTPAYAENLRLLEAAATDLKTADFRNIWQWLYKQSLFPLDLNRPLYFVIDGVDEADSPGSVIRLLSELYLTTIPVRFLVVSRKTHEISSAFQKLGRQVHMETIRMEGNRDDFRCYTNQEMDVAGEHSYREEVTAQILERAGGNFLWVHLAVQRINKCHTKIAVANALRDLPPGMEALYDRMAMSIQTQSSSSDQKLGTSILGWATCAQRPLGVEELSDALGNDGVLEISRTIGDLCGGFVVVDKEGKVAMIHETAREYLVRKGDRERPFVIDQRLTHDRLFKRCMTRLMDPTLRSQINRNQPPALLGYACNAWFVHLSLGSATHPDILDTVVKFLRGPPVLIWMNVTAKRKELRALVVASRYLTDVVLKLRQLHTENSLAHHQVVNVIEGWATDLIKIVGKFGTSLSQNPDSIHKLIPPFCPEETMIYQQFGRRESKTLQVSGFTNSTWDDCLARLSLEQGVVASAVIAAGSRVAILTNIRKSSCIYIYNSATFEEQRRITHPERVFMIQVNKLGDRLVSYGYTTTRVWNLATGDCIKLVDNPRKRPRPQTLLFVEKNNTILVGSEDRCIRSFNIDDESPEWSTRAVIEEESLEDTMVNFPTCSSLSPGGRMIAFSYRGHPVTAWELDPPMLINQCSKTLVDTDMTIQQNTWGEVVKLTWHPFSGEVLGLYLEGLMFKWDPYDEEANLTAQTGAHSLDISRDGSLVATGDAIGTVKLYATSDFSLLYQLSSQDAVLHLSFSTDSRRLYDVRGAYGNVWEPSTLVRLADSSEYPDHNSDAVSETESLTKVSLHTEHHFARVDNIIALSGQSIGPLYCYGTEDGVAVLCEVGRGKVCELERLTSYMSIEKVAWSEDGRLAAIADLSGKLAIKRISKVGKNRDTWQVIHEFDVTIPPGKGAISQLLFHTDGQQLFVSTPATLYSVNLESHRLIESVLKPQSLKLKWICHPTFPDYLLGFGNSRVHVFSWEDLREVQVYTYFPPRLETFATASLPHPHHERGSSFKGADETLGRIISNVDSSHVLLEISRITESGRPERKYLVFTVADILLDSVIATHSQSEPNSTSSDLSYMLLPPDVASRVREPLAFLSRGRLVFLDVDRWICTWRLPSVVRRPNGGRNSEAGIGSVEQYYFLPGDWVTASEANLCTIMPDGTLLCPKNGDVATVQFAKLRK